MKRPNAKLTEVDVRHLHGLRAKGWTHMKLCNEFGLSSTQVARILSGQQWRSVWLEFHAPGASERINVPELSDEEAEAEAKKLFEGLGIKPEVIK